MPSPKCGRHQWTLTPFLYPRLVQRLLKGVPQSARHLRAQCRTNSTASSSTVSELDPDHPISDLPTSHLNPSPSDYSRSHFADRCSLVIEAGAGGHGCISFLRDKYISAGPANGGDGGSGGNVYIQAIPRETSLHKLARRGAFKAGRGKNGQGRNKGGERGEDFVLEVPVGTVIRETSRWDPVSEEEGGKKNNYGTREDDVEEDPKARASRDKWIHHPAALPSEQHTTAFPALPGPRRSSLALHQPPAPIYLDLSKPMKKPMLLAAGAAGGFGNPHFTSRSIPRPRFATKGEAGMRLDLDLELKILADLGLVGLPNAGKSTLLRALSRSRARVGNWAFTTLRPNIGTVVLDDHSGRPRVASSSRSKGEEPRTRFTVADIPGLIEDAHLDRGLGLGFLRHIERAQVLAFVVDLSRENAAKAIQRLWNEIREYEKLRGVQHQPSERDTGSGEMMMQWHPLGSKNSSEGTSKQAALSITLKPWFVIATKADLPNTQENFLDLRRYLESPAQEADDWIKKQKGPIEAIPVSAIRGEGVERIIDYATKLFD
ncbi:MAG: GTPase of the mitochondrial inner membrane that associates with the large ribosomal subunit [Peltula sp. TS41687]|nr:MAG: GTPase of the mitochondrial inner membrane that associates with the large ribosomal subunit [Peltula sp. TS41687]